MKYGRVWTLVFLGFLGTQELTAKSRKTLSSNDPEGTAAASQKPAKPLLFIAPVDYAPWVLMNAEGQANGGILYEMAQLASTLIGLPVKVEAVPFQRFESLLSETDYDFTFVNQFHTIKGGVLLPKVVISTRLGLVYLAKNKQFADCSKIRSVAHTSQNSDALKALIQQHCGPVSIVNTYNLEQRVKMLSHGRADAFLGSDEEMDLVGWFGQPCHGLSFYRFFDVNWHVLVHAKSVLLNEPYRSKVDRFITRYASDFYQSIRKKVLGDRYCPTAR